MEPCGLILDENSEILYPEVIHWKPHGLCTESVDKLRTTNEQEDGYGVSCVYNCCWNNVCSFG